MCAFIRPRGPREYPFSEKTENGLKGLNGIVAMDNIRKFKKSVTKIDTVKHERKNIEEPISEHFDDSDHEYITPVAMDKETVLKNYWPLTQKYNDLYKRYEDAMFKNYLYKRQINELMGRIKFLENHINVINSK